MQAVGEACTVSFVLNEYWIGGAPSALAAETDGRRRRERRGAEGVEGRWCRCCSRRSRRRAPRRQGRPATSPARVALGNPSLLAGGGGHLAAREARDRRGSRRLGRSRWRASSSRPSAPRSLAPRGAAPAAAGGGARGRRGCRACRSPSGCSRRPRRRAVRAVPRPNPTHPSLSSSPRPALPPSCLRPVDPFPRAPPVAQVREMREAAEMSGHRRYLYNPLIAALYARLVAVDALPRAARAAPRAAAARRCRRRSTCARRRRRAAAAAGVRGAALRHPTLCARARLKFYLVPIQPPQLARTSSRATTAGAPPLTRSLAPPPQDPPLPPSMHRCILLTRVLPPPFPLVVWRNAGGTSTRRTRAAADGAAPDRAARLAAAGRLRGQRHRATRPRAARSRPRRCRRRRCATARSDYLRDAQATVDVTLFEAQYAPDPRGSNLPRLTADCFCLPLLLTRPRPRPPGPQGSRRRPRRRRRRLGRGASPTAAAVHHDCLLHVGRARARVREAGRRRRRAARAAVQHGRPYGVSCAASPSPLDVAVIPPPLPSCIATRKSTPDLFFARLPFSRYSSPSHVFGRFFADLHTFSDGERLHYPSGGRLLMRCTHTPVGAKGGGGSRAVEMPTRYIKTATISNGAATGEGVPGMPKRPPETPRERKAAQQTQGGGGLEQRFSLYIGGELYGPFARRAHAVLPPSRPRHHAAVQTFFPLETPSCDEDASSWLVVGGPAARARRHRCF